MTDTTRTRLAALLARMPELTDTEAATLLGVTRARVSQLRPAIEGELRTAPKPPAVAALSDADLLKRAIALSGLSARRFAVEILRRNERTIRRWLVGETHPSRPVRKQLEEIVEQGAAE